MRLGRRALILLTLATATASAIPLPAQAAALPVYVHSKPKFVPIGGVVTASVHCPVGTKVLGGGANIIGRNTATVLTESYPFDDKDAGTKPDDGWRATIVSRSAGSKKIVAVAVCQKGIAVQYADYFPTVPAGGHSTTQVACPSGTSVTGGGASLHTHHAIGIGLASTDPFDDPGEAGTIPDDGWQTTYDNESGSGQVAGFYAICTTASNFYVDQSGTVAPGQQSTLLAVCPNGTPAVGGGVSVTDATDTDDFEIAASYPTDGADRDTKPDDVWTGAASDIFSNAPVAMDVYVICRFVIF